jgi:hypothetical protein
MMNLSNAAQNQAIPEADRYINLGFIPGGTAGLQNFVQSPRSIIHGPIVIPAVQGYEKIRQIGSLAEFALLVVISDRPETARNWVEQVGPYLEDTSFVVILSAQAGPALQPYIETTPSQIQGAVIGLAGGMAYERLINQALIPFAKWSSFNLGLIAAVILMAGGGILNALRTHPSTRPPQPPSARGSDSDTNKGSPA